MQRLARLPWRYLAMRLAAAPLVLACLLSLTFLICRASPGDPFTDERAGAEQARTEQRARFHLDQPLGTQFVHYWGDLLRGDLGECYKKQGVRVSEVIGQFLPHSLLLGGLAFALAVLGGIALGALAALNQQGWADRSSMGVALLGIAVPMLVTGPLLCLVFQVQLGWASAPTAQQTYGNLLWLLLAAITLAAPYVGRIARLARAGLIESLGNDHVRTARATGMPEWQVVTRHVLRGGLLGVVSFAGPAVAQILTGSLVVEVVFQLPGLGTEFIQSAKVRDYNLVTGTVLVYAVFIIVCNLLADVIAAWLDPRLRHD